MYYIEVKSFEDYSSSEVYQTTIKIVPTEKRMEEDLRTAISWDQHYLITYQNPIFWIINFSSICVYIGKKRSEMASNNQLLGINEEIVFKFQRKSYRKHFEKVVTGILMRFIDRKIEKQIRVKNLDAQEIT